MRADGKLNDASIRRMDNLGFEWGLFESGYNNYSLAIQDGDDIVEGHPSYAWCEAMRKLHREGSLDEGEVNLLKFSNFNFEDNPKAPSTITTSRTSISSKENTKDNEEIGINVEDSTGLDAVETKDNEETATDDSDDDSTASNISSIHDKSKTSNPTDNNCSVAKVMTMEIMVDDSSTGSDESINVSDIVYLV